MKQAVLLTSDDNDNIAVIKCKGKTVEEVNAKVSEALAEEYGDTVTHIDFDWDDFNNNYRAGNMEVEFADDGMRDITVCETWIY